MLYLALACDFDGTLAQDGIVDDKVVTGLGKFRASGRRLILVTGRELPDLKTTFSRLDLFDYIVAENGGTLYTPGDGQEYDLAAAPPASFIAALRARGVGALRSAER